MTTPPGWYPDPGHAGHGQAPERWWDGSAWTAQTRAAQAPLSQPPTLPGNAPLGGPPPAAPPPFPAQPYQGQSYPPQPYPGQPVPGSTFGGPPPPARDGRRLAVIAGGIVLAAALVVVGAVALTGGDDEDSEAGRPFGESSAPAEQAPDGGSEGDAEEDAEGPFGQEEPDDPRGDAGPYTNAESGGVVLPVLDGWEEGDYSGGIALTSGRYDCPGQSAAGCVHGGVFLSVIPGAADVSPEEYARADIGANESDAYSEGSFGAVTDREEVLAEPVEVAGQDGFRVRTRIETASGTSGHVESVAFPAADDSGALVVIRSAIDIADDAPPVEDIDRIVTGAQAAATGPGTEA
ncbi:DUF2510 domain-containing protein [Streptomyces johnsoniae]|uniref:DUF2510 domain-containing protein n=1 Tax=Streptomyces johnsoniae TaxID=3075532 RepID=A0ABU2S1M4_9ACTN|nr:DUF2510 domain-containing protein [Streptomyces sp. DSM 41886]MDT0442896.1 DUF2510 domain-containing protein [Streptomyces sp. DSM 41886]